MVKAKRIQILFCLWFLVGLSCCSKEKPTPYRPSQQAAQWIAGDSLKTWKLAKRYNGKTRMNMGDCFLGYRQTFYKNGSVSDTNGKLGNCGPSLSGKWSIVSDSAGYTSIRIESPQIPELMGIDESFKDFRIFYLSQDSLHISFVHKQFGEKRRISDYLVPENTEITDRDFHH